MLSILAGSLALASCITQYPEYCVKEGICFVQPGATRVDIGQVEGIVSVAVRSFSASFAVSEEEISDALFMLPVYISDDIIKCTFNNGTGVLKGQFCAGLAYEHKLVIAAPKALGHGDCWAKTALVHEIAHFLLLEFLGTADPGHKLVDVWGPEGYVNNVKTFTTSFYCEE